MNTIALLLLLASQSGLRSTTLCTGDNPLDCLPPPAVCGDGIVHATEACDDGNRVDDDGCSMDCKRSSVVAARYRFDRTGVLELPAGMPQPTFDCRLDKWSGEGNLVCDGTNPVTFTPSGNPTAGVPVYWRPGGGSTAGSGVGFDGVDDFFDAGDPGAIWANAWTVYLSFKATCTGANTVLLGQYGPTGRAVRIFLTTTCAITVAASANGASATELSLGTVTTGEQQVVVVSWSPTAGLVGTRNAGSAVTLPFAGPIYDSPESLFIGRNGFGNPYAGTMSRATLWIGWAATVAEQARMVRSQYAAHGSMGEPLTVTRANAQSVVLKNADAEPFVTNVPAGQLAIGQNGTEIYGARTSRVLWNQRSSTNNTVGGICGTSSTWTKRGTATCVLSPIAAPDGTMTAERLTVGGAGDDIYLIATGFPAHASLSSSVWIRLVSGTPLIINSQGAPLGTMDVSSLVAEKWVLLDKASTAFKAASDGSAGFMFRSVSGTATFDVVRPWQVEGAIAGPDAEVQGSALPVAATGANGWNGITGNQWCVRWTGTPDGALGSGANRYMWALGQASGTNRAALYAGPSLFVFGTNDGSGLSKYVTGAHGGAAGLMTLTACSDNGTLSIYRDGVLISGSASDPGTGIFSESPVGIQIGSTSIAASAFNGSISEIVTCNTSNPALCR